MRIWYSIRMENTRITSCAQKQHRINESQTVTGAMCVEGWKKKRWNPHGMQVTTVEVRFGLDA